MVTALCSSFCIACLRPLTRRYVIGVNRDIARISYQLNSILISYD
ncbi:hypothetical protein M2G52_21560 [Vibrio vulnificus]|nr:hypothetical protein [Vibrio vulnificus]MCU8343783.1 hypothetical protein [Vibrio vulnificus]